MKRVACLACAGLLGVAQGAAAEQCFEMGPTQFVDGLDYCVSSALAPQSGNDYGPENLWDGSDATAWCEGAPGTTGERLTIRIEGGPPFRRLSFDNGYAKSARSFARNARPRVLAISTDTGVKMRATLRDDPGETIVELPLGQHRWVEMRIVEVYPGTHYQDTCLNGVFIDFEYEEMLLHQEQFGKKN